MNYVLFAIGCYIIMRALQVVFEEQRGKTWFKVAIKIWALFTIYSGLAALIVFYFENVNLLGFPGAD